MDAFQVQQTINCQGQLVDLSVPKVMGIVNITPDSFFKDSRAITNQSILNKVDEMVQQNVDIIDLGAYSSRPGAEDISGKKEWERLAPALDAIRQKYPDLLISVDTFRSEIAKKSVDQYQINIINDISGGELDKEIFDVVADYKMPYILMHMKGTPQNMQAQPTYKHLINEIVSYLAKCREILLNKGAKDIIIDPGFGFGKTLNHNFELMARLNEFKILESPLLVGISRKSMIYKYLNSSPDEALNGTTVLNTMALMQGAQILRVHDIKPAVEAVKLYVKVSENKN